MVNKKHDMEQDDIEITSEGEAYIEPELTDVEEKTDTFKNELRTKLQESETKRRELLEEMQRQKADFLNARKRLDEEKKRDRERAVIGHVEALIPLCDSFVMAMSNKDVWEKADATWRKGIEGIYAQLSGILSGYGVKTINPLHTAFNPHEHEAIGTTLVTQNDQHDTVVTVIQLGYSMARSDGSMEIIRPARVIIGAYEA